VIEGLVGVRARVGGLRVATILSPSLLYGCLYSYSLGTREVFEVTRLRQIDREMSSSLQRWLSKVLANRGVLITTEVLLKLRQTCPAAPLSTYYRP
jgi:hypothetical protein